MTIPELVDRIGGGDACQLARAFEQDNCNFFGLFHREG